MTSEASSSSNQEPTRAQAPSSSNSRYMYVGMVSCRYGNWLSSSIPIVMCGVYFAAVIVTVTVSKAEMVQLPTLVNPRETLTVKLTLTVRISRMVHTVLIRLLSQVISTEFSFLNNNGRLPIKKTLCIRA